MELIEKAKNGADELKEQTILMEQVFGISSNGITFKTNGPKRSKRQDTIARQYNLSRDTVELIERCAAEEKKNKYEIISEAVNLHYHMLYRKPPKETCIQDSLDDLIIDCDQNGELEELKETNPEKYQQLIKNLQKLIPMVLNLDENEEAVSIVIKSFSRELFKHIRQNRPSKQNAVDKIARNMSDPECGQIMFPEIVKPVDPEEKDVSDEDSKAKYDVYDGRHRHTAITQLQDKYGDDQYCFYYIIEPNITVEKTVIMNCSQSRWDIKAFAGSQKDVNEDYRKLYDIITNKNLKRVPITTRAAVSAEILHNSGNGRLIDDIKLMTFKIRKKNGSTEEIINELKIVRNLCDVFYEYGDRNRDTKRDRLMSAFDLMLRYTSTTAQVMENALQAYGKQVSVEEENFEHYVLYLCKVVSMYEGKDLDGRKALDKYYTGLKKRV